MNRKIILILLSILLFSCTTPLTIGANVQTISVNQTEEFDCERITYLSAFDTLGLTFSAERQNALSALLNKVAAAGGNAVVISNQVTNVAGSTITGDASDCKKLR